MSTEDHASLRRRFEQSLGEDAHNTDRLLARLDALVGESGLGPHAALLLMLTGVTLDEDEARRHWETAEEHRLALAGALGRDPGIRVALLDHFVNVNRRLVRPTLIDLDMVDTALRDASHDRLTGLASDRAFRISLQQELRRARRYEQRAAVVLFDLDGFAELNARCGGLVADRLLRETAMTLSNATRDIDVAARPGEDELAVLLPETDRNGAYLVAERVRREVERYFEGREAGGGPARLTLSGGVACYPDDAGSADDLLSCAAQALYEAKASGKNLVMVYRPERRRYLRFELDPGRFEIEVLAPGELAGSPRNYSRNGILFASPEPIAIGETIEIRLAGREAGDNRRALRLRGRVARLEELPRPERPAGAGDDVADDRFEIGVAFDLDWLEGADDLVELLEASRPDTRRAAT